MGEVDSKKRKLVVFYSLEGNTKFVAREIAATIEADLLELKPKKDLNTKGFMKYFWGGRQVVTKAKPALESFTVNPEDYDVIFIGTPIWAGNYTPALATFFSTVNLKQKSIALFCCHRGMNLGALDKMEAKLAGNEIIGKIDFIDPLKRNPKANRDRIRAWAREVMEKVES
ncbi:MAG: flavodoxin family protein [bacterium]|jgi:flavodoxin